jgi:hypothetical protein
MFHLLVESVLPEFDHNLATAIPTSKDYDQAKLYFYLPNITDPTDIP